MVDRYLTAIASKFWTERSSRLAALRTPADVSERQKYIRAKLLDTLGGFPQSKTPLAPKITGSFTRDGYRVDRLIYESLPGYFVTANLYVPTTGNGPFAAVLGTAGHSANGKAFEVYQRAFISLAKRGFIVLAYDPQDQGERLQYLDPATGKSATGGGSTADHIMSGLQCLLTGSNIARYEIWDGIRAFDYLVSRSDVDPARIAVIGNSGGGTQSAYLAALEPRLAAAAPSCYITSWETLWTKPGPQDSEQVFANFIRDGLDFSDFLIAFAPKPIMMLTATQDMFPIAGSRATHAEARQAFEHLGKADNVGYFEYDDGHGWSKPRREATTAWLEKWLHHNNTDASEPDFPIEPEANLLCTRTGQLATSLPSKTISILNQEMADEMYPRRKAASLRGGTALQSLIRARLGVPEHFGTPRIESKGAVEKDGYKVEKIAIESELGIVLSTLVLTPGKGAQRKAAVIVLSESPIDQERLPGSRLERLAQSGRIVIATDLRGIGEPAKDKKSGSYNAKYQTAMRALLVGKTMAGMQTFDLLNVFSYAASRPDIAANDIGIIGEGSTGVIALFAAALEPRVRKTISEKSILSYLDVVHARLHKDLQDLIVPGVLHDFDLPDLAKSLPKNSFAILNPRRPDGSAAVSSDVVKQYGPNLKVVVDQGVSAADLL